MAMLEQGLASTEIAGRLGRPRSTVHRQQEKSSNADGFRPDGADRLAWYRSLRDSGIGRPTRVPSPVLHQLAMGWSPEQSVERMELEGLAYSTRVGFIDRQVDSPERRRA